MAKKEIEFTFSLTSPYTDRGRTSRANYTIREIKEKLAKHTKKLNKPFSISQNVNQYLFSQGAKKPPRKISLKVVDGDEKLFVYLKDEEVKLPEKKKVAPKMELAAAPKDAKAGDATEDKTAVEQTADHGAEKKKEKADIVKEMERSRK